MNIYLASKSPRRQELLTQMGISFELLLVDPPEIVQPDETPEIYSRRVTQDKLEAAWEKLIQKQWPLLPILCADTEVVIDGDILGKPESDQAAFTMLRRLSGRTHEVITSVGIHYGDYQKINLNKTQVTFATLTDEDIHEYLATGNHKGKSGSYGIQSYIGQFISHIDGCFYSVMGLPLNVVRLLLIDLKEKFPDVPSTIK